MNGEVTNTNRIINLLRAVQRRFFRPGWSSRMAVILIIVAIISGVATYAALTSTPPFGNNPDTVIWLLNVDLVVLLMMVILLARMVAKIVVGRRKGAAGSRLHVRLVVTFSIMAAVPAIIMAVFSAFFFHFGVQSWFSERVKTAVHESRVVAEAYLEEHKNVIRADILAMANDLDRHAHMFMNNKVAFDRMMKTQSFIRNLPEAVIFTETGDVIAKASQRNVEIDLPASLLEKAQNGEVVVLTENDDNHMRAFVKLQNFPNSYLFVGRMVDKKVLAHLNKTQEAVDEYNRLEASYSGLRLTVTMIFIVVALLLVLAAIWSGFLLARQIVIPISRLIDASDRVRGGDFSARVEESGKIEEFDYLARAYNRMTKQIQEQRNALVSANRQLDIRRRFTETVLAGASAGIVGVDENGIVTLANSSAVNLFNSSGAANAEGGRLEGVNITSIVPDIAGILEEAHKKPDEVTQAQILFEAPDGRRLTLLVRIAIEMIGEEDKGAVLTFDDITELQVAQRKAAWSDVARRVAHEIKNPLTPIQLSAERIQKKYIGYIDNEKDREIFSQCIDTIIRHVGDIGRMVNEFSSFARMPEPVLKNENLLVHIRETMGLLKHAHENIDFVMLGHDDEKDGHIIVNMDAGQVRQAFTNLFKNSVESIEERISKEKKEKGKDSPGPGRIAVLVVPFNRGNSCCVSIVDNGVGIPENVDPSSLVEPYITHREKGTGLGLAIVSKIMDDHRGELVIGIPEQLKQSKSFSSLLKKAGFGTEKLEAGKPGAIFSLIFRVEEVKRSRGNLSDKGKNTGKTDEKPEKAEAKTA